MLTFHHIRRIKSLLKISLFALSLARGAIAWGTDYTWNDSVTSGNWTDSANWLPATGYPGTDDTAKFTGDAAASVYIDENIEIYQLNIDSGTSSTCNKLITIDFGTEEKTLTVHKFYMEDEYTGYHDSNLLITGKGTIHQVSSNSGRFDFPNDDSNHTHTITIDSDAVLKIEGSFYGDGDKLWFTGNGTLDIPASGANLDYGNKSQDFYDISNLTIKSSTSLTYYQRIETESILSDGTIQSFPATVTLTKKIQYSAITPVYPYTATVIGDSNTVFTLDGTELKAGITNGSLSLASNCATVSEGDYGYTKSFNLSQDGSSAGGIDGISITIYAPDGSGLEISTIKYNCNVNSWLGNKSSDASDESNWSSGSIPDSEDQYVSIGFPKSYYPDFSNTSIICKSMIISANAKATLGENCSLSISTVVNNGEITQSAGKLSTTSITNSSTGSFIQTDGILELTNDGDTAASINGSSFTLKNLSIAENASFSMPFDMSLDLLILNSGCTFSKNGKNLTLGWLQAETHNYSGSSDSDISLTEAFEADSIIIRLRDGNIYAEKSLTAKKDFIIGGAKYNSSSLKYEHFVKRPDSWYQNAADTDLQIEDGVSVSDSSALILSSGVVLTAGTSGKGNFYINGATLTGDSGTNSLVIPQNDKPENFCAEAVNSVISNINVICSDGSDDGSKAQIPASDCTLTNSANFDDAEFEITQAYTVSDCRIFLEFDGGSSGRELRNNGGELNLSSVLAAITTSDSSSFTAAYGSKNGSDEPEANPSSFYLYTSNTSWNTDASGDYSGSGNYTDSSGDYRTVTPYLTIPQYISGSNGNISCGYVITDKWGKRLKSYSPFTSVADGIPEAEKCTRSYPTFKTVSGCIGSDRIILSFTSPIVSDISKLSYYDNDSGQAISISESLTSLLPACFEVFYFDDNGNAVTSDDLKIDSSRNARISESSSSEKLGLVTLYLNRNLTLSDMETYYIRLIQHPSYKGITKDPVTMKSGYYVTFIQQCDKSHSEAGKNYMIMNSAHTISDFATGAVIPSYAYSSGQSSGGESIEDIYKNVYGSNSYAVHDFSKAQKNFGSVTYGTEITLISKGYDGSSSNSSLPYNIRLYISDSPDSASLFSDYNASFGKNLNCWLPALSETESVFENYESSHNSHYWEFSSSLVSENEPEKGYTFKIEEDAIKQMAGGSQLSFLYALCDSSKKLLTRYLAPQLNDSVTGTYNLTDSKKVPLFSFTLTDTSNPASLEMWYITLKSITEQRGGVTILNNVINAANGEQTVLKVNMPSSGNLDVMVMTIDGNIIKYLAHGSAGAGEHFYYWDGKNKAGSPVSRGLYFVIVKAPGIDENRKVMVVK